MTKRTTHGLLVADRGVYPELKSIASKAGWRVKSIPDSELDNVSDEAIAKKYGKGRHILLTHDKSAYKENSDKGFTGYIVYDDVFTKDEFEGFLKNFKWFMGIFKAKDIVGKMIILYKDGFYPYHI